MYSPKELETFFSEYFPKTKSVIEDMWGENRGELQEFILEWLNLANDSWMTPYFNDMLYWTKVGSHKYTNPWDVL